MVQSKTQRTGAYRPNASVVISRMKSPITLGRVDHEMHPPTRKEHSASGQPAILSSTPRTALSGKGDDFY